VRAHTGKAIVAGVAALALALPGFSSSNNGGGGGGGGSGSLADCAKNPNTCNTGKVKSGGAMTYTIEKLITGWNLNSANSNTFDFAEVLDGVLPQVFIPTPDLKPTLNPDLMVSAEQTKTSPQTLVYKINPKAVWNDGVPVSADDFIYQWKTENGTDCKACVSATNAGYNQIQSVTGSDGGKTVTVVMKTPYTDWKIMFGPMYPAHVAEAHGGTSTPAGLAKSFTYLDKTQPTYSAGPFVISKYVKDTSVTETPNPKWYGKTKPSLSRLVFRIITDQTQEVPALQNNEVQAIYPQPNADIVNQVKGLSDVQSFVNIHGLNWEHLDFNLKNPLLSDKVLRTALFTAVDRKQIIAKTVGQFASGIKPLGNHMYLPGQDGYKDNTSSTGQGTGDLAKAKSMLTSAGYTGVGSALKNKAGKPVSIRCSFTAGNVLRQQTCQLVQTQLKALGVKVTPTPIDSLGDTLDSGDFDLILYAWTGAPFVFAGAQQIWVSTSGSDFGHDINKNVDNLLTQAATSTDPSKSKDLMDQADVSLTADAYVLPLFQKPTYIAVYKKYVNIRDDATSYGPPYNTQEWGIRAS
jgi:peptide/nickel transport system substrate-binding protein